MSRAKKKAEVVIFLHYGDPEHRPMQTTQFHGSATELRKRLAEARRDKWPLRVHVDGKPLRAGGNHAADALRLLTKRRRSK